MSDTDFEFYCPKCGSMPDSQDELPTESDSPIFKIRYYSQFGHSWTNNWTILDDSDLLE